MDARFSQRIKDVLSYSKEEAIRLGNAHIGTEHLFLGILRDGEGLAIDVLVVLGVELYDLRMAIEKSIRNDQPSSVTDPDSLPLLKSAERILKLTHLEARSMKERTIDTNHLLLAILKDDNNYATRYLVENGITYNKVKKEISDSQPEGKADFPGDARMTRSENAPNAPIYPRPLRQSGKPVCNNPKEVNRPRNLPALRSQQAPIAVPTGTPGTADLARSM